MGVRLLEMNFRKLALTQPHLAESRDALIKRTVAERVGLRANLHSANHRIDLGDAQKFTGGGQHTRTSR